MNIGLYKQQLDNIMSYYHTDTLLKKYSHLRRMHCERNICYELSKQWTSTEFQWYMSYLTKKGEFK
jgi:hypothetical protein